MCCALRCLTSCCRCCAVCAANNSDILIRILPFAAAGRSSNSICSACRRTYRMVWGTEQTNPSSDAGGNAGAAPAMQELLLHCFLSTFLNEKHPPRAMQEQVLHCPTLLLHCLLLCLRGQETSRFASPAQAEHRCRSWVCGFVRPTTRPVAATNHQFRVRAATRRRTLYLPQRLCSRLMRPRFAAPPHIFSAPQQRRSDLGLSDRQTDLD